MQPSSAQQLSIDEDATALISLAGVLDTGATGVSADPFHAVELYTRAIDGGGDAYALTRLANLLEFGAEGVPANPVRAVELYNRAIKYAPQFCYKNFYAAARDNAVDTNIALLVRSRGRPASHIEVSRQFRFEAVNALVGRWTRYRF